MLIDDVDLWTGDMIVQVLKRDPTENEIGRLIDAKIIRPVVDRVYPFESIAEALAHVETGRAKGKVVVKLR